jgi:hypothetical protein
VQDENQRGSKNLSGTNFNIAVFFGDGPQGKIQDVFYNPARPTISKIFSRFEKSLQRIISV